MSATEFAEWKAFYQLSPFGPWRDNYHAAMIAHILAAANTPSKRRKPRFQSFFYQSPSAQRDKHRDNVINFFRARAERKPDLG